MKMNHVMALLNKYVLEGLFLTAFIMVIEYVVTGEGFENAAICLLVIIAHRAYFPLVIMMGPPPLGGPPQ